ncbi:MAG TPA: lamin tail domain-containing protein [Verrucomicrobiae bacterium]|nr:lamin tail domain-containing protein [Verrucomicrobiae bacterium]
MKATALLLCLLAVVVSNSSASDSVFITEFMAANGGAIWDADGDSSDWIELQNAGGTSVNLAGWHLTDDPNELGKWTFPALILAPGDFLVVFASGKDRTQPDLELHTNFQLDNEGEYLALVRPDSSIAQEFAPAFPAQVQDVSFGVTVGVITNVLLGLNQPLKWRVPISAVELAANWMATDFNDSNWANGVAGFGFDTSTRFAAFIRTDVEAAMRGVNASAFLRWSFVYDAEEAPPLGALTLQLRYDDGFVAYLNGEEIARRHAPDPALWNSTATEEQPDGAAMALTNIDVTAGLPWLRDGTNVLAIHALNLAVADDDLLVAAQLVARSKPTLVERYFPNVTPGWSNSVAYLGVVADTKFSVDRGFYSTPFTVALTNATPGSTIRYTLDGSAPGPGMGMLYLGAIPINKTTTLRASSFKPGYLPSDIDTHTYIFIEDVIHQTSATAIARRFPATWTDAPADYEMDTNVIGPGDIFAGRYAATIRDDLKAIPTLSLVMNIVDLFGTAGIYLNPGMHGTEWERPTSVEVIFPDGTKGDQVNCGVRIEGNASRSLSYGKLSFRLVFKDQYGPGQWHDRIFGTYSNATDHLDDLVLRANAQEGWVGDRSDSTYLRDTFARETLLAMGGVASHSRWFHLYLNGLYWGIYELVERPDASFSSAYFGGDKDDWDAVTLGSSGYDRASNGDLNAWNALFSLCTADLSLTSNYMRLLGRNGNGTPNPALPNYLDVTNLVDYMILNIYLAMGDWPGNNYWTGRARTINSTGFKFYPWDGDYSMDNVWGDNTEACCGVATPYAACRRSAEFRMLFADRVQKHLFKGGALYVDGLQPQWDPNNPERNVPAWRFSKLSDGIRRALVGESARWGDLRRSTPYTPDQDWQRAITLLLTGFFSQRHSIVMQQLRAVGLFPPFDAPEFSQSGGAVPAGYLLTLTNRSASGAIYYTLDGSDPRLIGDALNPAAIVYTGPIELHRATTVRARIRLSARWSAIVEADFYLQQDLSKLQLSELMYNPPKVGQIDGEEFEFLELQNTGTELLDLTGLTFTRGLDFTFTNGTLLPPGQYFVIARNSAQFTARYPAAPFHGLYTGKLDNNGETLALSTPLGATLFSVTYDNAAPWPAEADNSGLSLQRMTFSLDPTNPVSWVAAPPTPGAPLPAGLQDSDGDGLPDGWEQTYGFISGVNEANDDPDGDGLSNLAEFIAGTNPRLAEDALRLKPVSATRSGTNVVVLLEFEARSNKTYTISYSSGGEATNWTRLLNISATPSNRFLTVNDVLPPTVSRRFYRLATPKLP